MTVYQSGFFVKEFPKENKDVEHIVVTEDLGDRDKSLDLMRRRMLIENDYVAAVFIRAYVLMSGKGYTAILILSLKVFLII